MLAREIDRERAILDSNTRRNGRSAKKANAASRLDDDGDDDGDDGLS